MHININKVKSGLFYILADMIIICAVNVGIYAVLKTNGIGNMQDINLPYVAATNMLFNLVFMILTGVYKNTWRYARISSLARCV
ncbi:MAG: hypothetical protein RR177_05120, partial [Oscillospiraceae bacterium]